MLRTAALVLVLGLVTLPFSFAFPGGATTQVRMCSNGYLWLNGTNTTADFTPTVARSLRLFDCCPMSVPSMRM